MMSQVKPVTWFVDDPRPNAFFSRSPFHSWKFIVNSVLVLANILSLTLIASKYWGVAGGYWKFSVLAFLLLNVIYPYWRAILRHGKIHELYLSGQLTVEAAGSPVDQILSVADDSMNEGLRNTSFMFLLFLLTLVLYRFEHLK